MAADYPPLNKFYIASYAANDRSYPILAIRLDPRTAGYRVPEDLSPHPDSKRYPNHVFTGAQPASGDQVVTHIYEILPSPYVPFTRYDDDLGPIQGRRRSVKNEGQQADLAADKKVSYEGREGSAIVSNEIEETWSIATDEDGNSLFPLKDRDFYDASRGPVQERRQLFVPTGEEEGTLENVNGVITQTSYEPYNEFLSVKVVQTYKVDGPQLIGRATDNDGQLVTVTTQRKGSLNYIPPNPTATRTVEVNREDAESLVERIVDTPEIFTAKTFSLERPDPIPQKFRVAVPLQSTQEVVAGQAELPELSEGEISRNEEQRNKFLKRVSATSRDQTVLPQTLSQKATDNDRQEVTITETLQLGNTDEVPTATKTVESEALGDGNYVVRKTEVPEVFGAESYRKTREDLTPQKFRASQEDLTFEQSVAGIANPNISLGTGEFAKSEQQVNKFVKRVSTTSRVITEAVTLLERVLTQDGQIGTRTLVLASGDQSFVPSALLVDASVEALGDGRTVKTETLVPQVFSALALSSERPDPVPQKFRINIPTKTTQQTLAGQASTPTLSTNQLAKSEQQVTQFVKRVSTTERDSPQLTSLSGEIYTSELGGGLATVVESLGSNPQVNPQFGTVSAEKENLGNNQFLVRETRLTTPLPELKGQNYDDTFDVTIPFIRQFVEAGTELPDEPSNIEPRDTLHSVNTQINYEGAKEKLLDVLYVSGHIQDVSLPDKLLSVRFYVDYADNTSTSTGSGNSAEVRGTVGVNVNSDLLYDIEDGYRGPANAEKYLFFLPKESSSLDDILEKLNGAELWPIIRPKSHRIISSFTSETQTISCTISLPNNLSQSSSRNRTPQTRIFPIPPTLHGSISIQSITTGTNSATRSFAIQSPNRGLITVGPITVTVNAQESAGTLPATSPPSFPVGRYLYSLDVSPYRFGLVRVTAIVVDITSSMV